MKGMRTQPHRIHPRRKTIRCILGYHSFRHHQHISHIGLGVSALNWLKVFQHAGIHAEVWPLVDAKELFRRLTQAQTQATAHDEVPISHVVISAPWIATPDWLTLVQAFPRIHFAVICHSNVGFLQADPQGMKLYREALDLQTAVHNFTAAANSHKFTTWVQYAYGVPVHWLPNLYFLEAHGHEVPRPLWTHGTLRLASFGAMRLLKNHMTACAAALELHRRLGVDTEFWVNTGRDEHTNAVLRSMREMTHDVRGFQFVTNHWESWPAFRKTVRHMHVLLQISYTESFNMVTADGVSQGVPSVVSDAIEWAPANWYADTDNALDVANRALALLQDTHAAREGLAALLQHNQRGLASWRTFLLHRDAETDA